MRASAAKSSARRASVRQHAPKRPAAQRGKVEALDQEREQDADQVVIDAEPWDERESEPESTFERAPQELGDVERDVEADHCRKESDIERSS